MILTFDVTKCHFKSNKIQLTTSTVADLEAEVAAAEATAALPVSDIP